MSDDKTPRDLLDWLGITDAPRWWVARPLGPLVSVLLAIQLVLAVVAAFAVLLHTVAMARSGASEGINLGAGALIVALLGAPFLIWSTVLKHQTLRYQKEGHITDRIKKAVEQLGAEKTVKVRGKDAEGKDITIEETRPNLEVRIGAILSLERIAQDSTRYDRGRDHVRVMEILCAYVRENAPASSAQDHPFGEWKPLKDDPTEEERAAHLARREERFGDFFIEGQVYQWARTVPAPRADIAIALRVIGRRTPEQRLAEARWGKDAGPGDAWVFDTPCPSLPDATTAEIRADFAARLAEWKRTIDSYRGYRLDLRNTNLQRADLSDLALSGARLDGARMEGAHLRKARMEGANLRNARMDGANLSDARMQGAGLPYSGLEGAFLSGTCLQGADLSSARMEGTNLIDARMEGAHLRTTRMEGADLSEARLQGANLRYAHMECAKLHGARFDASTNWTYAVLRGASLQSVDFSNTPISAEQVNATFGDDSTRLPADIPRPAHWPRAELDWDDFETELRKWRADPEGYKPPD